MGTCTRNCANAHKNKKQTKLLKKLNAKQYYLSNANVLKSLIKLKSLILAQIERWRDALHMQVERQHRELAL